jgi:hypothetical protein
MYMCDRLAGGFKTYDACKYAIDQATRTAKVAFVMPSKIAIDEVFDRVVAQAGNLKVTAIDSDRSPGHVFADIMQHVKNAPEDRGEILFITHAALLSLPYWHRRDQWHLIIDELPAVVDDLRRRIPNTHTFISDCIEQRDFNQAYFEAVPSETGRQQLKKLAENKNQDEVYDVFQPIAKRLLDPNYGVYFHRANYARIVDKVGAQDDRDNELQCFTVLRPSVLDGFASVTIMGAMFTESLLYLIWSKQGVNFKPHKIDRQRAIPKTYNNGSLLTIEYFFDKQWSKTFRDKGENWQNILTEVEDSMAGDDFVLVHNNDVDLTGRFPNAHKAPVVCHGLNKYRHIHNTAYLCALNGTPAAYGFAEVFGVSADELRRAFYLQSLYQGVMRTSLRDPDNKDPKRVVVMDKDAADYLAPYFPGCTVMRKASVKNVADRTAGRRKVYRDDSARSKARSNRKRVLDEVRALGNTVPRMSLIRSIYSDDVIPLDVESNDVFIEELRACVTEMVASKYENILISPADFNVNKAKDTKRGLENIEKVFGIWLDNDGGELSHEGLRAIFPHLRMVAFNTYTPTNWMGEKRYRVFIPTTQSVTVEADAKLKTEIMNLVQKQGYRNYLTPIETEIAGAAKLLRNLIACADSNQAPTEDQLVQHVTRLHELATAIEAKPIGKKLLGDVLKKLHEIPIYKVLRALSVDAVWLQNMHNQLSDGLQALRGELGLVKYSGFDVSKLTASSLFFIPCRTKDSSFFFEDYNGSELDPISWLAAPTTADLFDEPEDVPVPAPVAAPSRSMDEVRSALRSEDSAKQLRDVQVQQKMVNDAVSAYRLVPAGIGQANNAFWVLACRLRDIGLDDPAVRSQLASCAVGQSERQKQIKSIMQNLHRTKYTNRSA